jgi:hypothetical protein
VIRQFRVRGLPAFEQDVKVTVSKVKEVPVKVGDTVTVLCSATVEAVYGSQGQEVDLGNLVPRRITEVRRSE